MHIRAAENQDAGAVGLPRDVVDRVERVLEYHRASKHTPESVRLLTPRASLSGQPSPYQTFSGLPKTALPTGLLDLPASALALMREGLGALPDSQIAPPQNLKTLATWLFMAYGVNVEKRFGIYKCGLRTCPSAGALYPCEVYVGAFAIDGLEPGLYSFNPREFALVKLREGPEALGQIKRGRPDLAFLRNVPAALLVSTIYWRSAWKYRGRSFRMALLDAGHLTANLVAAANGLGIQTMTRLKMNDNTTRELIGVPSDCPFGCFEAVQAMVVWADDAAHPMAGEMPGYQPMPPIERAPLSPGFVPYGSVVAAHYDCVAPGVPVREVRPPITETSPLSAAHPMQELPITEALGGGPSLRRVLLKRRSAHDFAHVGIPRNRFLAINQSAFRTGTFVPLHPDGPHIGLVRPFWVIHDVTGMTNGIWYYHPPADKWVLLKRGDYRSESRFMCLQQPRCGDCAALCVMAANLPLLMHGGGPDVYRLAHLEAGIAGQRLAVAAGASGIAASGVGSFYDDEIRQFLGLLQTGWEVLYVTALGFSARETQPASHPGLGIG